MGQVLHGSATTTEAVRRAIQPCQARLRALAKRQGLAPETVAKWKRRNSVADQRTGPKEAHSTVPSVEEETIVVAFLRHTLLPLDDCLYAVQATIPHMTRSSLHRCLQRHGLSCLIAAVPYGVHTVLTENGTHFTTPGTVTSAAPLIKTAIAAGETFAPTASTQPVPATTWSIARPNRGIPGRTVRSSG